MKKSVDILGLPIISITEGRELGMSKTLLIDAKNGTVAAITIEDDDWYRGVKLLPYSSVIAIGDDAVTITNSENILALEEAGDYESMLDANVRIIGTKAITKTGTIQGIVSEIYVGEAGKIEKCEISSEDGASSEIAADQISIFGKQVTVIDAEKKNDNTSIKSEASQETKPKPQPAPATVKDKPAAPKAATKPEPATATPDSKHTTGDSAADQAKQLADKATEERHRRFLLGKKATRRITTDNGIVIIESGAEITEEVLQKAKLANKFIELSMNVQ